MVFPRDYEKYKELFTEDRKVFIKGRASIGDDPQGKVILESLLPFDAAPRELWIQFDNKDSYAAHAEELGTVLRESDGTSRVVLYLKEERAKKMLPANWSVGVDDALLEKLRERFGVENVKVVEKSIEMR